MAITNTDAGPINNITHGPITRGNIIAPLIINALNINAGTYRFMTDMATWPTTDEFVANCSLASRKPQTNSPTNQITNRGRNL